MEITNDIVEPRFDIDRFSYAWWSHYPELRYAHRLEGWLAAGWVALTEIDYSGRGPMTPEGYLNGTNHFVVLDGIKYAPTEYGGQYSAILPHVHVVCSNKGGYWIRVQEFLMKFGGAGWWLCRRDER